MENWSGKNIKGYELLERIGTGGFGAVYKATQSTIDREVAMKIILPHFANHPDFVRRFETEAQLIARLEHLHIVPLYDYWRDPDGAYLVMRWLRGGSLREALEDKPFDIEAAALLLDQIAGALAVAHRNHVVHRDLKPGNILLDEDGNAYLADFGIAKDFNRAGITEVDAIVGSPDYLAPEQASGEDVSPRTDVYSLGVVLYEMLVGQHPFPNLNRVERLYKHLSDPLPQITTLPDDACDEVNAVIQRATAKNPAQRYADAMALAIAFREAIKIRTPESLEETLTQREQEILSRIVAGMSNKQIADELVITVGTVKWYVNQIFRKLNVRSRVQAIVRARDLNLIVSGNRSEPYATQVTALITDSFQPKNPYKGLQAFQAADNQDFFGREKLIQKLVARLAESTRDARFLAVVGPSGSGKSSLVKSGLIPALWRGDVPKSEKWFVVEMLPGSHPLDELEVALTRVSTRESSHLREHLGRDERGLLRACQLILPDDGSEIALIIDQFEEVFTLVEDETARIHFLSILQTAIRDPRSRLRVIITLRADFYDRPLHYPEFGDLIQNRMETVLPLSADDLERAIVRPAERVGVTFESGLVSTIVGDVHYQPAALPLLQYAMTELFEQRQGRVLTRQAYRDIGGTVGALAKRAEQLYAELDSEAQHIAHQMFLRLVTLGEGVRDTRRRVGRNELLALAPDSEVIDEVIDTFAGFRLLSLDNDPATRSPTVEVAHEAILHEWERLRLWIDDNREDIHMQQQLSHMTKEWLNANRDASFLASGLRLEQFEKWANETHHVLTPDERAYLEASLAERAQQIRMITAQKQREASLKQRSVRFLQALVVVLLLATAGAFGLTNEARAARERAETERERAEVERQRAEDQTRIAHSRELVGYATSTLDTDAELSTLLALQAVNTTYTVDGTVLPEAETVLHQAVQALRTPLRIPSARYPDGATINFLYNATGTRLMFPVEYSEASGVLGITGIANPLTGEILYTIPGDPVGYISSDNHVITYGGTVEAPTFVLWDITSDQQAEQLSSVTLPNEFIQAAWGEVSQDLRFAVTVSKSAVTQVWDLVTGQEIDSTYLEELPRFYGHPAFSPDGTRLANWNADGTLSLVDTTTWEEDVRLTPSGTTITSYSFSPDGRTIISGNRNGTITVWDSDTGAEKNTLALEVTPSFTSLNADGTRLAIGARSGQITIIDTESRQEIVTLAGSPNNGIALSPDGTHVATLHNNGFVQIWDLVPGREVMTAIISEPNTDAGATSLDYSPDGTQFVTASVSKTPMVWDALTGQRVLVLTGHTARVWAADWSPNGALIATGGEDTEVKVWDSTTGMELVTLRGHSDGVYGVAFSPDSTLIASSSFDETVRIWDVASGETVLVLDQPAASKGVAWGPDGQRIAAATDIADDMNGHVLIWNALTGEQQLDIPLGNTRTGLVMFSPDGTQIAVGLQEAHFAQIFDSHSGEALFILAEHISNVPGVAYSPDGTRIATTGSNEDQRAILWDATTGRQLLTLHSRADGVGRVAFSPDGKYLALLNMDGTVRVFVLPIPDLMALAQSRLTRWWTDAECRQYLRLATCPPTNGPTLSE